MMNFPDNVQIYIVGGYVRDRMQGLEGKDHDFVVVGATADMMIANGFQQVGADFPVYLHPITGDEFALARQESKTGPGYHGFETRFDPSVTLEDDLRRRDLTINAMARRVISWNEYGHAKLSDVVIDPFDGSEDLEAGIIRHVSEAFAEDPVRVLRAARFAARFGFTVAPETMILMKELVEKGELNHVTVERIWIELEKSMSSTTQPFVFFSVLEECGALKVVLPELHPIDPEWENMLPELSADERIAALFLNSFDNDIDVMSERMHMPVHIKRLAIHATAVARIFRVVDPTPATLVQTLNIIDAFRSSDIFGVINILNATHEEKLVNAAFQLESAFGIAANISFGSLSNDQQMTLKGKDIGDAITAARITAVSR